MKALIKQRGNPNGNELVHFSMTSEKLLCNNGAWNCLHTADKPTVTCPECIARINAFRNKR